MKISLAIGLAAALAANSFAQPVGTWRRLSPAGGPNGATFSGMIFDSNRGVLVAWDQINRWEWDGTRWAMVGSTLAPWAPPFRRSGFRQSAVFDSSQSLLGWVTLGYSGYWPYLIWTITSVPSFTGGNSGLRTPTANSESAASAINPLSGLALVIGVESPGGNWLNVRAPSYYGLDPIQSTASPGARSQASIAYDRLLSEYVMFGGTVNGMGSATSPLTWAFGNNDWYVTAFTGPAPRYGHAMAFDASRGRTIMFGGITNGTPDNTDMYAWEWDGIAWIRGSAGPVPRINAAMVYDSANSRILMFGGSPIAEPSATMTDLWEYRVPTAPRMLNQPRNIRALEGEPVRMEITLAPDATLRQPRWRKAGTVMADAPGYAGTTSPALFIEAARFADAGGYEFLIRNDVGTAISDPIFLTVLCKADADRSGFVDSDDFVAFTEAFERGCVSVGFGAELPDPNCKARADFDYSGFVDSDDFVGYIEAFSAGC